MKTIRVGSRESRLAVVQSELVMDAIRAAHPEVGLELVTMKTTGDKILDRTLDKVGGKGLFVKELDAALLDGRVDLTVHSCKDLPMEEDPRIPLAGFSRREDPRDVLVLPQGAEELSCLDGVLDADGTDCARTERAFVRALDGGCSAPTAAHARLEGDTVTIDGLYVTDAGEVRRGRLSGPRAQGEALGEALARRLKEGGTCLEK